MPGDHNLKGKRSKRHMKILPSKKCRTSYSFCGFIRITYLCCKDHMFIFRNHLLLLSGSIFHFWVYMDAYLCDKDHLSFCDFKRTPICVIRTTFHFVVLKNRVVLLKPQGGPTNTNSQNMLSNFDHPIILNYVCIFVSLTDI